MKINSMISNRHINIYVFIVEFILYFLSIFRWKVGTDWNTYYNLMSFYEKDSIYVDRLEIGNIFIKNILMNFGFMDGRYWIMAFATVTLFFMFYSFRNSQNEKMTLGLFIFLGIFFNMLNGIRQYFAISLFAFSLNFIVEKQYIKYFAIILLSYFIHTSAIILIPTLFFIIHSYKKKTIYIMLIISIVLSFIAPYTNIISVIANLNDQYSVYSQSNTRISDFSILRLLFPIIIFFISMKQYDKIYTNNEATIFFNLSLLFLYLTIIFPGLPIISRVTFYYEISYLFLIPILIKNLPKTEGKLLNWFVFTYGFLFVLVTMYIRGNNSVFPFLLRIDLLNYRTLLLLFITIFCCYFFAKIMVSINLSNGRKKDFRNNSGL